MKIRKAWALVFITVCVVLALSSFNKNVFRTSAAKKQIDFPVKNLVSNLTIVAVKLDRDVVVLSLRNDYQKAITAFAVSSSGITTRTEMIGTDGVIAQGATKTKSYETPSPTSPDYAITIQAVVFEDYTADGSPEIIKQILDARAGEKRQIGRILPILRDTISVLSAPSRQKWQGIRSRIAELPDLEEGRSFEFRTGLANAKYRALLKINDLELLQLERGDDVARQACADHREGYESKRTMLSEPVIGNQQLR